MQVARFEPASFPLQDCNYANRIFLRDMMEILQFSIMIKKQGKSGF